MNKKLMIGLAAAGVVVVAGALYFFLLKPKDEVTLARNAIEGNGEATCAFTDPETNSTGKLYAKDGDTRIDITGETNGQSTTVYILTKDDTGYFWSAGESQGFKFASTEADTVEGANEGLALDDLTEEDFKKEYERNKISCEGGVDANLLEVPGSIEFVDFSDLAQPPTDAQQGGNTDTPTPEELEQQLRELEQQYNY